MKLFRTSVVAVLLASATASAVPEKQAPAEVTPAEAKSWLTLFETIVDTVVTHRDECSRMATGLNAVVDANQPTIAMARDAKAKGKRLPASAMQKMATSAQRMIAALDKCGRDETVGAAFKRIDLGSRQ